MARPDTLYLVAERVRGGVPVARALPEFLDVFYACQDPGGRMAMFAREPGPSGSARVDALLAAACEYLSKRYALSGRPDWIRAPERYLADPWFTTASDAPGAREYLAFASPAEFRSRNIFTEAQPLRRASMRIVEGVSPVVGVIETGD